jgi:hypothetical protein
MITRLKLKPGQKGTKSLLEKFGDSLVCVRYRNDEASRTYACVIEIMHCTLPQPLPSKGGELRIPSP